MNMQIRFNYDIDDYELFTGERWTKIYVQEDVDAMQAEIEALKAGKIRAYDNGVEDGRKPNTNLVKELTDEEILKMAADMFHYSEYRLVIDFARAILRKASEK